MLSPTVVLDGRIAGVWKRALRRKCVIVQIRLFSAPGQDEMGAIEAAAEDYARFLGLPVELSLEAV